MKNSVNPTVVDASDKVSTGEIIAYGMGGVASTMPSEFKKSFSMPFLTDVVGLPIQLMGTITMLMTIWDAINDPIIGGIATAPTAAGENIVPIYILEVFCQLLLLFYFL